MARFSFFAEGLPGIDLEELKGKLIVLEGTDGVGRSTHITLLKQWLENNGHAVLDTGMTRSALAWRSRLPAKAERVMPVSNTAWPLFSNHCFSRVMCVERPTPSVPSSTMSFPLSSSRSMPGSPSAKKLNRAIVGSLFSSCQSKPQ